MEFNLHFRLGQTQNHAKKGVRRPDEYRKYCKVKRAFKMMTIYDFIDTRQDYKITEAFAKLKGLHYHTDLPTDSDMNDNQIRMIHRYK